MIPLWKELEFYKEYQARLRSHVGVERANEIISEALYLMSLGTNDFLENYYVFPTRRIHYTVSQYQDFLLSIAENFVRELYALGARKLSITGLVPVGCLPLERATNILGDHGCNEEYNNVALTFNAKLENVIARLNRELPQLKALSANAYSVVSDIIARPSAYGMCYLLLLSPSLVFLFLSAMHDTMMVTMIMVFCALCSFFLSSSYCMCLV